MNLLQDIARWGACVSLLQGSPKSVVMPLSLGYETDTQTAANFLCMIWFFSNGSTISYVLWMTSRFHIKDQMVECHYHSSVMHGLMLLWHVSCPR